MDIKKSPSGYEQEPRTIHIDGIMASFCSAEGGRYKGVARYVAFEREVPSVQVRVKKRISCTIQYYQGVLLTERNHALNYSL